MIEQDTLKLLRECDAGVKMGIQSIEDVIAHVQREEFAKCLHQCKEQHEKLQQEIAELLGKYRDEGKEPNPIAKSMSWLKTNVKLGLDDSDATVADLMTDGCNMGVKSLCRYLNQYQAADEVSKDVAKRLIQQEQQLCNQMQKFL